MFMVGRVRTCFAQRNQVVFEFAEQWISAENENKKCKSISVGPYFVVELLNSDFYASECVGDLRSGMRLPVVALAGGLRLCGLALLLVQDKFL